jgi:hypothetical protein
LPLTPMTRVSTRVARFLLVRYTNFLLDIVWLFQIGPLCLDG